MELVPVTNHHTATTSQTFPRPAPHVEDPNKPKKPQVKNLLSNKLELAEQRRQVWYAPLDGTVTAEDVTKPEFWANCVYKCKIGDRIEVVAADGSWDGELSVRSVLKAGLVVEWRLAPKVYTPVGQLKKASQTEESQYEIQMIDGKHRIMRKSDGVIVVGDNFPDHHTAQQALRDFLGIKTA